MPKSLGQLSDRELLEDLRFYNDATLATPENFGLTAAEAQALKTDLDNFEAALDAWDAVNHEYDERREAKDAERGKTLTRGRQQRRLTRAKADMTGENLASAGLSPYDEVKTTSASPSSAPFALVDYGKLRHTVNFRDQNSPDTDKKPGGVLGAEIWVKIGGDAPVDNKECQYLATDTATPYVHSFSGEDAGKTAWYLLRWVSKNGDKGDWSEAVGATING